MNNTTAHLLASATFGAVVFSNPAHAGGEAGELALRDLGSKFVGYSTGAGDDGSVNVLNPMFVQYVLPADKQHEYPVVMIHGGGGQGSDWTETPDGRDGWADYFVAAGWDVYIVDRPGHGRSQSNGSCGNGTLGTANSAIISRLSTADADVWPGGEPTPTNEAVIAWTASSTTAPYCGNAVAAETISALLDEIGPAILLAHSAGGGSTFRVPDLNAKNVVGIIAFEAAGSNPVAPGFGGGAPVIADWNLEPSLPSNFEAVEVDGCAMQGDRPSQLVSYANVPVVLVGSERGLSTGPDVLACQEAVWQQAGVDATSVYLPDRGLAGGGHFAMAQLDNAEYARVFIELATEIEADASK
jgi:pimeloyl-ACP methyl ester carboxylesterase